MTMADSSYTGDYTGDYTYSDDSGTYTGSASEKSLPRTPTAAPAAQNTQDKKAPSPSKPGATKLAESTDSYTYSYNYSYDSSSSSHARPVGTAAGKKATPAVGYTESIPKQPRNTNGSVDNSYSYSYTDDDGDGSYTYSYSYSGSQTETAPPPALRVPKVEVTGAGSAKRTAVTAPLAVTSTAAVLSNAKSTESYSYSYSDNEDGSYTYSDGSYYYDGSRYYTEGSYDDEDSYYYSNTYSYTGDSSYYYSYSSAGSRDGKEKRGCRRADTASGSSDYYYDSGYSGDYTDNSDYYYYSYYYHGSSYTGEESHYSYLYSYDYYSYSATSKSLTSTTSSYDYGSVATSLLSESRTAAHRELVVLRAPSIDVPRPPPAPKRCFVAFKSSEDTVWAFLQRLMALQQFYEVQRAAVSGQGVAAVSFTQRTRSASRAAATADQDDTSTPFIPTKDGCFSERSMRIAFRVLRLNHLERQQALKNAPVPLPMEAMLDIFNTCVAARAKEQVAQAFLAHDPYRCGEMSLTKLTALLRRLGIGTSPIVEGYRISIGASTEGALEMVVNVERMVQPGAPAAAADAQVKAEGVASPTNAAAPASAKSQQLMQWEVIPVYVLRIIRNSAVNQRSTLIRWKNKTLFMGRHAIVRNVATKTLFERLKTYIEAASYLCVVASVFSIKDTGKGTLMVQYPQFIRSVLLADPPANRGVAATAHVAPRKLLYIENLFHAVFHPLEILQAYEAGLPVPRYNGDWAVESTLYSTNDTEEKRRRNVVPGISVDMHLIPTLPARPPGEVQLSFVLQKVRVPARPPPHSRCFCLVSAMTPSRVFLPAIEVPVRRIVASTKTCSGYTWVFHDKKHKKKTTALQFAGTAVDSIYVECCYETYDVWPPQSREDAVAAADGAAVSTTPFSTTTVWCAGYAVFGVDNAKTAVLPVKAGSLLQEQPHDSAAWRSGVPARAEATAALAPYRNSVNPGKHSNSCIPKACRRDYTKNAPEKAHQVKVKVHKTKKPISGTERLPARYIAFQRHVPMISQLRAVVELVAKETSHAPQAFRQQAVRYIFSVAADSALLDQLCALWAYRERHWKAAERKDEQYKQRALLACVAALYGLNNSCARSKHTFAKFLAKGKALRMPIDPSAPMVPVRI
ncbi:hypothetical protein GH5_03402 [Leishmania sp. Ghana 2012 LV757]|uniref:hypothetical protein n=1 Tax=Leishmania sp. Ghana 2012 LV757 TaxID=2803181 RepID=UPI001B5D5F1B|nr:hypothetical protein GH5_03402 [Leishmania sp. Ghana 2012 LV757]